MSLDFRKGSFEYLKSCFEKFIFFYYHVGKIIIIISTPFKISFPRKYNKSHGFYF